MDKFQDFTLSDIEEGLDKLAIIVATYGEKYLPLFECLHDERERMLHQNTTLNLALSRAQELHKNATQNSTHIMTH